MKARLLRAVIWQGGTSVLARGTRYVAVLVLGRLLSPEDFGVFASLYVLVEGLVLLSGMGLGEALVVMRDRERETAATVFFLAVAFGLSAYAVAWFVAPFVSRFYGLEDGTRVFRVLAVVLVVHAFRVVPMRVLERTLDFRAKMLPTFLGALTYVAVAVLLAARGGAVWSFVIALVLAATVETAAYWWRSPWRPHVGPSREMVRPLLAFGIPVIIGGAWTYLFGTVDRVALARWGGPGVLGIYAFAFSLASLPATLGSAVVAGVLLPAYGLLGSDPERRLSIHLRAAELIAGVAVLFGVLCVTLSLPALRLAYDHKWDPAVPVLQVLVVGGLFRSLVTLVGDLLVGVGRPRAFQSMSMIQLLVAVIGVPLVMTRGGAAGVAVVMSTASAVALLSGWSLASSALHVPLRRFASCLVRPMVAGGAALLAVVGAAQLAVAAGAVGVAAGVLAALTAFGACWWLTDPALRTDVRLLRGGRGP